MMRKNSPHAEKFETEVAPVTGVSIGTPRIIVLGGPFRSGSTWLFNCLQELARAAGFTVTPLYADDLTDEVEAAFRTGRLVIVKTHRPSAALMAQARAWGGLLLVTVRDPRDCASSLMTQFGHDFRRAFADTKRSCDATLRAQALFTPMVLRYEDGFTTRPETLSLLCRRAGWKVDEAARAGIFDALSPAAVRRKIETYVQNGVFDGSIPALQFHAQTHWHPNHVGDGAVKKYKKTLGLPRHLLVLAANLRFARRFGYRV